MGVRGVADRLVFHRDKNQATRERPIKSRARSAHLEESVQHGRQAKVGPQLLIIQLVARLTQALSPWGRGVEGKRGVCV